MRRTPDKCDPRCGSTSRAGWAAEPPDLPLAPACFEVIEGRRQVQPCCSRWAQKPIGADMVEAVLAKDLDALEARLMRLGYNTKVLAELLDITPKEVRAFLRGQLPPERTQELHHGLLAAGVPL